MNGDNVENIEAKKKKRFGCLIAVIVVVILLAAAVISIPSILTFQAKAKQSEARQNLGAIYTTQVAYCGEEQHSQYLDEVRLLKIAEVKEDLGEIYKAQQDYFGKEGHYASGDNCFDALDLKNFGRSEYGFYCSSDKIPCGSCGKCKPCYDSCPDPEILNFKEDSFTIFAVGNIDSDSVCDRWSINDAMEIINIKSDLDE